MGAHFCYTQPKSDRDPTRRRTLVRGKSGGGSFLTMPPKPKKTPADTPTSSAVMTVPRFVAAKASGTKLSVLTAYDFSWAGIFDAAGVDALLVGDSVAMVVQGHPTTLAVTLAHII